MSKDEKKIEEERVEEKAEETTKTKTKEAKVKDEETFEVSEEDGVTYEEGEEPTEQEVIPGVPNRLASRSDIIRVAGKDVVFPKFFVVATKAGLVAYAPTGQRVSTPETTTEGKIRLTKRIAHMNVKARQNVLPGDLRPAGTVAPR